MGAAIGLREDFDGAGLRRLARTTKSANQGRRLLALAEICDGASRSDAARIGGVGLQIVRDWVVRFNARGPDGLLDGKHGRVGRSQCRLVSGELCAGSSGWQFFATVWAGWGEDCVGACSAGSQWLAPFSGVTLILPVGRY